MTLQIKEFFDIDTAAFTYVISDSQTKKSAIIDPVMNYDQYSGVVSYKSADNIIKYSQENNLIIEWILETHIHADHLTAAKYLKEKFDAKIGVGSNIIDVLNYWIPFFNLENEMGGQNTEFDRFFEDGDVLKLGNLEVKILHTPGHTPACVSYLIDDAVFVGDTLFMPDVGTARADFPGGNPATLYNSIQRILSLPGNTRILVCHDYFPNSREAEFISTVSEQNEKNILINKTVTLEEFIKIRSKRDKNLSVPKLLYPSLQVNLRAGDLGKPSANGKRFIKIPVTIA